MAPVSGPGDSRDEPDNRIGVGERPTDLPPGLGFSNNELLGEQILAFWEKGTAEESRHVRPGSIGLLY
jgi:hypothetical protein